MQMESTPRFRPKEGAATQLCLLYLELLLLSLVLSSLIVCYILVLAVDGSGHKSKSFEEKVLNDNTLLIIKLPYL